MPLQPGQIFTSSGGGLTQPAVDETTTITAPTTPEADLGYQPAWQVPEDMLGDKKGFDMGAAGHTPLGWKRPARDLFFTLQQPGINDRCRAHRLLPDDADTQQLARNLYLVSIRQIGDVKDPGDAEIERWLDDIGLPALRLVDMAYTRLAHPTDEHEKAFAASRKYDPSSKLTTFSIPTDCLPAKVLHSPAAFERSFALRELTLKQTVEAAEAAEDPDQGYEVRILQIMWSIARIGSRTLSTSPEDLLVRRRWLSQIGSRAFMLVAGTYSRMHEVERSLADRFLDAAVPLD